jgi:flagellar biogenesis protein FliO
MSLIRIRRERKELGTDARKGLASGRLLLVLALVIVLMWYLGRF